jgi:hypothetical protein
MVVVGSLKKNRVEGGGGLAIGNNINRRNWQAAALMGWDVVYVFSNKRILETGAGAGKGFFSLKILTVFKRCHYPCG